MNEILYHLEDQIATITIHCPQRLNALGKSALLELNELLIKAEEDLSVLCVVINASGEKAFCVGGNIKEEVHMDGYAAYDFSLMGQQLIRTIRNHRTPVITAAQGYILGAGMEILLASDFAFLTKDAKLSIPSINLGSMCGFGGSQLLPRAVGTMRAKEILMLGRHILAEEALSLGLALKAVDHSQLMDEAYAFAKELVQQAPFALRCIKQAVNRGMEGDLEAGLFLEAQLFSRVQASEDKNRGMEAFINKTKVSTYVNR
jgi:enoyl-CoA hydratase